MPTYSPQMQEALETMAARILLSVGVILAMVVFLVGPVEVTCGFEPQWVIDKEAPATWHWLQLATR